MSFESQAYTDALVSHALSSGHFAQVNEHEPKSRVGTGLTAAVWFTRIRPAPGASGLAATSVVMLFTLRMYLSMTAEPQDAIDPAMLAATDDLMTAYSSDFQLDGMIRNIDLLGEFGQPLEALSGYLDVGGTKHRVTDIFIPLVVNDVFAQEP